MPAQLIQAHVDCGQRRTPGGGENVPVVIAHQRDVIGYPAAQFAERIGRSAGDLIAAAENRVYAAIAAQGQVSGMTTPGLASLAMQSITGRQRQARLGQYLARSGRAQPR